MQVQVKIENKWVRCGQCGHKLCRITKDRFYIEGIEFKCHSCKCGNLADGVQSGQENGK